MLTVVDVRSFTRKPYRGNTLATGVLTIQHKQRDKFYKNYNFDSIESKGLLAVTHPIR